MNNKSIINIIQIHELSSQKKLSSRSVPNNKNTITAIINKLDPPNGELHPHPKLLKRLSSFDIWLLPPLNVEKFIISLTYSYARVDKYVTSNRFLSNKLFSSFSDKSLYFFTNSRCLAFSLLSDMLLAKLSIDFIL